MRDITFKEDTMADLSHNGPRIISRVICNFREMICMLRDLRAIVYINLRRSEQQRRETAFGKNVDYDLSQIRTNLRIPQDYHEILINPFFFHPMNQTKTAQNYNVSVRFELKSPLSVFSYSVQSNVFYLKIGANAKVVTET